MAGGRRDGLLDAGMRRAQPPLKFSGTVIAATPRKPGSTCFRSNRSTAALTSTNRPGARIKTVASLLAAIVALALLGLGVGTAHAANIRIQSEVDVHDSGQWENVIEKRYLKENPGDTLSPEFVGTGKVLENAEAGKADVVIADAPLLEKTFVEDGYSQEALGRPIFYNDFVIVGPNSDPASVATKDPRNAVGAFETIGKASAANSHIRFESRDDAAGTNAQEQILWGMTEGVPKRGACNAKAPSEGRFEPGTGACSGGEPAWYIHTGLGPELNLEATSRCTREMEEVTPKGGCYTMLDRGTWLKNEVNFGNLRIVSEGNAEGKGGASLQTNYFHAYVLSSAKAPYPNKTKPNYVAGERFVSFLTSESTQKALAEYPTKKEPAGHPDAIASATLTANPDPALPNGTTTITATMSDTAPPNRPLPHYPEVQLQVFQGSWVNVRGELGETNAVGEVSFPGAPMNGSATKFRVTVPQHSDTEGVFNLFSAGIANGEPLSVPVGSEAQEGKSKETKTVPGSTETPNQSCHGDPVDCATGNFSETQTDLEVGGLGVGLDLTRTYNARAAAIATAPGPFGYGWTASFEDHLTSEEGGTRITLTQAEGGTVPFTESGAAWVAPSWSQDALSGSTGSGFTLTLPGRTTYRFSGTGRLEAVADRNGNETNLTYNGSGQLTTITDPTGRKLTLAYDTEGLVEKATDPMGHVVRYAYESKNLKSVTLPGETSPNWQFGYDGSHRMTEVIDGRGGKTSNEYDSSNRVVSQTDPAERTTTWSYPEPLHTTITDHATGAVTEEWFNTNNQPYEIIRGAGTASATTETFAYEGGLLTYRRDGDGHTTTYGYDGAGDRTSEAVAEGDRTTWTFDSSHDLITSTTPEGETTTIERDAHGNPKNISRPAPGGETQTVSYEYGPHGEVKSMTDPLGHTWGYGYDAHGDRTSETDPEGDERTWAYDEDSRVTSTVGPRGNAAGALPAEYESKTERDAQGRPVKVTDPLGHTTEYAYDADGNQSSETDPLGHKTKFAYDADDEETKVEMPDGATEETAYDGAGRVISQTDGDGHKATYVRNVLEEPVEVIDPLERRTIQTFDAAGNLKTKKDPDRRTTSYSYDSANRLTEISYSDGATHSLGFGYDRDGNLTSMTDGSGTSFYGYDQLGRLVSSEDGASETVGYKYNLGDQQVGLAYPNGKSISRLYDKAGRLQSLTDWLGHTTTFGYDRDSDPTSTTFPSATGDKDEYSFDRADRMSSATFKKGAETLASLGYTRNKIGQLESLTGKGLPGAEAESFAYDENGQLKTAGAAAYEYDAADSLTKAPGTTNAFDKAAELESATGATFTYDKEGERTKRTPTSGPATTYRYDQAGNLTAVERPAESESPAIAESFAYDGTGLLTARTVGLSTHHLGWDTSEGLPLLLSDGENSYVYGPGGLPVEQISSGEVPTYLHHDQLGSTRLLTNAEGKAAATFSYSSYGALEGHTGTATTPLGFAGQWTDAATGLQYLRARWYEPGTGQFLTRDPAVEMSHTPYGYAEDDPLDNYDPSGKVCVGVSTFDGIPVGPSINPGDCASEAADAVGNAASFAYHHPGLVASPLLFATCVGQPELCPLAAEVGLGTVLATDVTRAATEECFTVEDTLNDLLVTVAGSLPGGVFEATAGSYGPELTPAALRALQALLNAPGTLAGFAKETGGG